MPFFEEIHQEFKNKNVTVIGISVSDPIPSAKNFAENTNVSYILASDSKDRQFDVKGKTKMVKLYAKSETLPTREYLLYF